MLSPHFVVLGIGLVGLPELLDAGEVEKVIEEGTRVTALLVGLDVDELLVAGMKSLLTSLLVVDDPLLRFDASEELEDLGLNLVPVYEGGGSAVNPKQRSRTQLTIVGEGLSRVDDLARVPKAGRAEVEGDLRSALLSRQEHRSHESRV